MEKLQLVGVASALLLSAETLPADLIVNGSFELPPTGFVGYASGSDLPGWTIHGEVNTVHSSYWQAGDGTQSVDLVSDPWGNGIGVGTYVEQSFATTIGVAYELTFLYGNNAGHPWATADLLVMGADVLLSVGLRHEGSTYADMDYTPFIQTFVSDSALTTLRFVHTGSPEPEWSGIALDAVSVQVAAVPEPRSLPTAMLLLSAVPLLLLRHRRQATP